MCLYRLCPGAPFVEGEGVGGILGAVHADTDDVVTAPEFGRQRDGNVDDLGVGFDAG